MTRLVTPNVASREIEQKRRRKPPRFFAVSLSSLHAFLIAFALAGYPIVATFSTALGLNGTTLAVGVRAIVLALSLLLVLPAISHLKNRQFKYLAIYAIFWGAYLLRMLADTSLEPSQLSKAASEYWIWAVGVCLIPSLALLGVDTHGSLPRAFKLTWMALGAASFLAIFFGSTFVTRLDGTQSDTGRLALESLNPISAGHLGASLMVISGWYWWSALRPTFSQKAASLASMIAGLYLLISAASRGPLFALICVIGIVLLTLRLQRMIKVAAAVVVIAAMAVPIALSYVDLETVQLVARIAASTSGEDQSVGSREESFSGAWNQFLESPWLGDFLDERSTGYYPHNLILEAFMATGLSGGVALFTLTLIALWKSYTMIRECRTYAWIGLIFTQYCVGAQMSGAIYSSATFWAFSVLVIFLSRTQVARRGNPPSFDRFKPSNELSAALETPVTSPLNHRPRLFRESEKPTNE